MQHSAISGQLSAKSKQLPLIMWITLIKKMNFAILQLWFLISAHLRQSTANFVLLELTADR